PQPRGARIRSLRRHHRQTLFAARTARSPAGDLDGIAMRRRDVHHFPPSEGLPITPSAVVLEFHRLMPGVSVRWALLVLPDVDRAPRAAWSALVHPPPRPPRSEVQLAHFGRGVYARNDTPGRQIRRIEPV